ncbi:hypothetical protein JXB01_04060, partial [Candidatus Micrarchaeota archaeon]|nr:hypothetical protein [Candidatus Micrarchaeota archaeon]
KNAAFEFFLRVAIIIKFQEVLIHLIKDLFLSLLLPIGIALRSFYFTRRLGGLLMGVSLAMYFILPVSYVYAGAIYDHLGGTGKLVYEVSDITAGQMNPYKDFGSNTSIPGVKNLSEVKEEFEGNPQEKLSEALGSLDLCKAFGGASEAYKEDKGFLSGIWDSLTGMFDMISYGLDVGLMDLDLDEGETIDILGRTVFFSLFFSFFGLMATIAATRGLSAAFGGDLEIAGLTHLI